MKFFSLISKDVDVAPNSRVLAPADFSAVMDSQELLEHVTMDVETYREQVRQECERLKETAKQEGFEEGMQKWSSQLAFLEKEAHEAHNKIKAAIVPLAIASIKKIIGRELELKPDAVISLITSALKAVNQSKKVTIFVNPLELEIIEQGKPAFKQVMEYAESLIITPKSDVKKGGCIIETEAGIINAEVDTQLLALEKAFKEILKETPPEKDEAVSNEDHSSQE